MAAYDSDDGFIYQPGELSVVSVSNGRQQWLAPFSGDANAKPGRIKVGTCAGGGCTGAAQLYSEGTIAFVTDNDFAFDETTRYGTRHLSLAVGAFNIGDLKALDDAASRKALTPGMALDQDVMRRLIRGDDRTGAPALQTLEMIASRSMNFFGDITISTLDADGRSQLKELLLTTPALYGYGGQSDVARIQTGHLIWNGSADAPGTVAHDGAGTGSGTLRMEAGRISFGYGGYGQPDGISMLDRLILGFSDVALSASDRITANNAGSLAVYQQQSAYVSGQGRQYSGGNLSIVAPLLTGEAGSVNRITAGGGIAIVAPASGAGDWSSVGAAELGAEWSLHAGKGLRLDTAVALPSGKLTLKAQDDLALGAHAHLDLSGRTVTFFEDAAATRYSWGGNLVLESVAGDIRQDAGALIDLSAEHNRAGSLLVTALGASAGRVDLQGMIRGQASGHYNAGGTEIPYLSGQVSVRAQTLGDAPDAAFAALNQRLNAGDVSGLRSFRIAQGDLTIGDGLKANQIDVSLDQGHLTVAGLVDAAGERVGSIRLSGAAGLTLQAQALLDAHGTQLRLDSHGQVIDAANRASVVLNAGQGTLTLVSGASIDLRHGTGDARVQAGVAPADAIARGRLELYAPRLGDDAAGRVAVDAGGRYAIQGAQSIVLNAMRRYDDTDPDAVLRDGSNVAGGQGYRLVDQAYLDRKHAQGETFIAQALRNQDLLDVRLAGLTGQAYRDVFHLRPGVEVVTAGNLVINGDLDLSGYRYASFNATAPAYRHRAGARPGDTDYGLGEPGALVMRAGGDLSIYGSVTDGFYLQEGLTTPDDGGWLLLPGVQAFGGDVVVPREGVVLADGTRFPAGKVLNYDLPLKAARLAAGTELPVPAQLESPLMLAADTVLSGDVTLPDGRIYKAGTPVGPQGLALASGSILGAGFRLPEGASLAALTWPAGVALPSIADWNVNTRPDAVYLAGNLSLPLGALIPSQTDVKLPDGAIQVDLRPAGAVNRNWAIARMLPEEAQSWSLQLVAGADISAVDPRMTRVDGRGNLVLADTHYTLYRQYAVELTVPLVWTQLGLDSWGMQDYWADYGLSAPPKVGDPVVGEPWEGGSFCDPAELCAPGKPIRRWTQDGLDNWGMQDYWADYGLTAPPKIGDVVVGEPWEDGDFCEPKELCTYDGATKVGDMLHAYPTAQNFSVLRTGTGDLDLIAGGDIALQSLYGIYTAGTSTASRAGSEAAAFNRSRAMAADGTYLNTSKTGVVPENETPAGPGYEALVDGGKDSTYAAWYPDGGGNLLLRAGGDFTGDILADYNPTSPGDNLRSQRNSGNVGNWLWRQGSGDTAGVDPIAASWWINFGTYVQGGESLKRNYSYPLTDDEEQALGATPELVGFTGVGTLGGGNLTVQVTGNAGLLTRRGASHSVTVQPRSQGLVLAVASSGRVLADGDLLLTGGGDMHISIGGDLNPGLTARALPEPNTVVTDAADYRQQDLNLNGVLTSLRGDLTLQASASGGVALAYATGGQLLTDPRDTRAADPYAAPQATATGGPTLILGDAVAALDTRGDLALAGSGDPGRLVLPTSMPYALGDGALRSGGHGWFSLWTRNTAIHLFAAGGDLAPSVQLGNVSGGGSMREGSNFSPTGGRFIWPSQLSVAAPGGSLYLGASALGRTRPAQYDAAYSLLLAPSVNARLSLLAGDSIYAGGYAVSQSAASLDALPTPFRPAFYAQDQIVSGAMQVHNLSADAVRPTEIQFPLFTFGPGTAAVDLHAGSILPARMYARTGDIVGLDSGAMLTFHNGTRIGQVWYEGGPVWMRAGRDIVRSGSLLSASDRFPGELAATPSLSVTLGGHRSGNLFLHSGVNDVSIVEAGRDILYSTYNVLGPGTLEISAGRNLVQDDQAAISSLDPNVIGDSRPGADLVVQAGAGPQGAGMLYRNLLDHYLNRQRVEGTGHFGLSNPNPATPLAGQPGTVVRTYDELTLSDWLRSEYGYRGEAIDGSAEGYLASLQARYNAANPASKTVLRDVYAKEAASDAYLVNWLSSRYGYQAADPADARAYFDGLAPAQQRIFARNVYFAELRAAGREYNNTLGPRAGNYLRGRNVIAALLYQPILDDDGRPLPVWDGAGQFAQDTAGRPYYQPYAYQGDVILYQGAQHNGAIRTLGGGNIDVLTPGGTQTYGVDGVPPATGKDETGREIIPAGVFTQGKGDIALYAQGSILLGQSRIMTAAGGNILGWSAAGDINAGRGSKTTLVYVPPLRVYDAFGNVAITPDVPATGAGIATLNDGDMDLIAPLGTIDAGEAGIRVAGNVNIAALQVVNADNIQVQGEAKGVPVTAAVNTGALTQASAAATSAATAAQESVQRSRAAARQNLPSIITVQILGFGSEPLSSNGSPSSVAYDPSSPVAILGLGAMGQTQRSHLTMQEQARAHGGL